MPRREDLSDFEEDDDEAIIDKTKKKNKEKKTYVFEIKLSENVNEKYEYNYKEIVREHEERAKKVDSDIEIIEIIDDDPVPKKKYKKPVPIDPEDDYDLEDDFIDDTEANDEVVPDKVSTEHGGFYINVGRLKYIELEDGVSATGDDLRASGGGIPGRTTTPGCTSRPPARRTPTPGGRRVATPGVGSTTPTGMQSSIKSFFGKEGPPRQGKTMLKSPGGK